MPVKTLCGTNVISSTREVSSRPGLCVPWQNYSYGLLTQPQVAMSCDATQQESEFLGPHPMMEPLEAAAAQTIVRRRAGLGAALASHRPAVQVSYCYAPASAAISKTAFWWTHAMWWFMRSGTCGHPQDSVFSKDCSVSSSAQSYHAPLSLKGGSTRARDTVVAAAQGLRGRGQSPVRRRDRHPCQRAVPRDRDPCGRSARQQRWLGRTCRRPQHAILGRAGSGTLLLCNEPGRYRPVAFTGWDCCLGSHGRA